MYTKTGQELVDKVNRSMETRNLPLLLSPSKNILTMINEYSWKNKIFRAKWYNIQTIVKKHS